MAADEEEVVVALAASLVDGWVDDTTLTLATHQHSSAPRALFAVLLLLLANARNNKQTSSNITNNLRQTSKISEPMRRTMHRRILCYCFPGLSVYVSVIERVMEADVVLALFY